MDTFASGYMGIVPTGGAFEVCTNMIQEFLDYNGHAADLPLFPVQWTNLPYCTTKNGRVPFMTNDFIPKLVHH